MPILDYEKPLPPLVPTYRKVTGYVLGGIGLLAIAVMPFVNAVLTGDLVLVGGFGLILGFVIRFQHWGKTSPSEYIPIPKYRKLLIGMLIGPGFIGLAAGLFLGNESPGAVACQIISFGAILFGIAIGFRRRVDV